MRRRGGRGLRRAAAGVTAVVAVLALGACSGDSDDGPGEGGSEGATAASRGIETDAEIGVVRGRLGAAATDEVLAEVTAVVDAWIDAGFGGGYPRSDFDDAYADFTPVARRLALRQAPILSNAGVGDGLDEVEITGRVVRVDVLAPKGRVAGATARVRVTFAMSGATERADRVAGRLLLTPGRDGWRVFGFDVRREEGA